MSRQKIANYLSKIAEGVEKGELALTSGDESVDLIIPGEPEFELEVEKEDDGETSLEIEIEYPETENGESLKVE